MKKLLFTLVFLIGFIYGKSQNSKNHVIKINFKHINAITDGDDVKGYYMFYFKDKIKGGDFLYELEVLDVNLDKIATKEIIANKYFILLEASYNNELLCFKFFDLNERRVILKYYNEKAEEVNEDSFIPSLYESQMLLIATNSEEALDKYSFLSPIKDVGFINLSLLQYNLTDVAYNLTYYPNDLEEGIWEYGTHYESKYTELVEIIEANKDIIVIYLTKKKSPVANKSELSVIVLDTKTGKEKYIVKLGEEFKENITSCIFNEEKNELTTLGYFCEKGEKSFLKKNLGFVVNTFNSSGENIGANLYSWEKDIAPLLEMNDPDEISNLNNIFLHDFIEMPTGSRYAIGETVKGLSKSEKGSFYIFEFDDNGKIKHIEVVQKSDDRSSNPLGSSLKNSTSYVSHYNFAYTKAINNGNTLAIFYKYQSSSNNAVIGVITNTEGEYLDDKIKVPSEASHTKILPGIEENILFIEYFKSRQKLDMNFKKLNY